MTSLVMVHTHLLPVRHSSLIKDLITFFPCSFVRFDSEASMSHAVHGFFDKMINPGLIGLSELYFCLPPFN